MSEQLDEIGYLKVDQLIDERTINTVSKYFENKINRGEWVAKSQLGNEDSTKLGYYSDPLIEVILAEYLPVIESNTGLELEPTYSFSRVYQEGEELFPHSDRPACEISVTVNVASVNEISPIWMQYKNNDPSKYLLKPGDAIIYKGCEVLHWRRPLPKGHLTVQFMLHYVNKNGPFANYRFDKRNALSLDKPF